jgi:hypothetical protein
MDSCCHRRTGAGDNRLLGMFRRVSHFHGAMGEPAGGRQVVLEMNDQLIAG